MNARLSICASAAVLASVVVAAGPAQAAPTVTTVATGLDNPRDLDFGPDGRLYVAEAGHGGPACLPGGEEGTTCVGFTSGVSRINLKTHQHHRIVTGLISLADNTGSGATGVDGISFRPDGALFGIVTASRDAIPPGLPPAATAKPRRQLGRLIRVRRPGKVRFVADVGHADFQWSISHKDLVPGQFPDANPYGVLALRRVTWVVDAGSNTIDRVGRKGKVKIVKFIPNPPASDAVPTCIDRGPDGALYIGELTGGGNKPGASRVWRFQPRTGRLTKWATGLTAVTGCGFAPNGKFYAVELSTLGLDNAAPGTGALVRVPPHSSGPRVVVSKLDFPGGFAARGRSLYISNWSIAPAKPAMGPSGEVLRIKR